jgi:hypothetical protein
LRWASLRTAVVVVILWSLPRSDLGEGSQTSVLWAPVDAYTAALGCGEVGVAMDNVVGIVAVVQPLATRAAI